MEDSQIVELYMLRDEMAITHTDTKYGKLCHHISMNILSCAEDSEECVSDTYQKLWSTIPPNRPLSFMAYLGRICRNCSISKWRQNTAQKRSGNGELLLSELSDCLPTGRGSIEDELEVKHITKLIEQWLEGLKPHDRALFLRRYWYGDSVKGLSAEFHIPANSLSPRLFRLRKSLRLALEKEGVLL